MDPGLVSKGFLMDPPESFPLGLHGLVWDFLNMQAAKEGIFLTFLRCLGVIPLLDNIRRNFKDQGSVCGAKLVATSCPVPKDPRLTTDCPRPTSQDWLLPHHFPPPSSWQGFGMVSWSDLGVLLLPPGFCLGPKSGFSRCPPMEPPWCASIEWQIWLYLTHSCVSPCLLYLGSPCNPPSWERKVLIGHQNRVLALVPW